LQVSTEALQKGNDPSLPPLMNPTMLEASDDLTNLSHLNEPAGLCQSFEEHLGFHMLTACLPNAVLQAIRLRYAQKEIYTYSGIVLIATNPFARVDSLYVPGMVQIYAGKQRASQAPHLFAIAEEAFG
jgi:myosin V